MSLAEELMADFEEEDADELEQMMENMKGEDDIEEATELVAGKSDYSSVYDVAKMTLTDEYRELMSTLAAELERTDEVHVTAPLESDPQYKLIVRLSHELLGQILAPATCIVVSVTASTTQGKSLEPDELNAVREACDLAEKLHTV
ncbi:unnamed protein product [Nippostrongylus brasiliensis]|uniref:U4/U6 small nuclear ribonucleoprotein Prp31 (inferred by orthology to a human protein) n=1 Tax=Nippostrongylus brasiliensis TaxID=27835 RepID=A0A0N4YX91_NIPBR|nr:unnamed protein product [Nippostrongylus brasiliensis]